MKANGSVGTMALRKRVRRAHSKSRMAGTFYLLGALAFAVLAFLPALNVGGKDLWVSNFYEPIFAAFGGAFDLVGVIVAILYLWILLVCATNFFKCFSKLRWLTKRSWRYVNGYNRNIRAMEDMGKRFSGSFATIVSVSFLIAILQPNPLDITITSFAYIILAVGVAIHFFSGLIAGKVSVFDVHGNSGNVEEIKREIGIFVYFFRNLVQIAALVGIVYFFLPVCAIGAMIKDVLGGANPLGGNLVTTIVPVALQALIVICALVLIRHATATTEFNRLGMEGKGMRNYRVFSFFVFLLAVGVFAIDYILVKPEPIVYNFAYVAGIAFVAFLVDCIFKTRIEAESEEEYAVMGEMRKDKTEQPCTPPVCPRPVYSGQGMPMQAPQSMMPYQQASAQLAYQQQPVYIPVYYPYPIQQPAPTTAPAPVEVKVVSSPAPAPKPVEVKIVAPPAPTPAPTSAPAPAPAPACIKPEPFSAEKEKKETLDKQSEEREKTIDPNKEWKVRCPRCGKLLTVRDTSPYHRCPSCDKVFLLRKFQTYVKKD